MIDAEKLLDGFAENERLIECKPQDLRDIAARLELKVKEGAGKEKVTYRLMRGVLLVYEPS